VAPLSARESVTDFAVLVIFEFATVLFYNPQSHGFFSQYFSCSQVSHGTIGICSSFVLVVVKERETCPIDFDMCDQHEAIV